MEYKKTHSCQNTYVYNCNLSLHFSNTSLDKLSFDSREHVGCIIRPALLKTHYQWRLTWLTLLLWPAKFGRKLVSGTRRQWPSPRRDRDISLPRPTRWQFSLRRDRNETYWDVETKTTTLAISKVREIYSHCARGALVYTCVAFEITYGNAMLPLTIVCQPHCWSVSIHV